MQNFTNRLFGFLITSYMIVLLVSMFIAMFFKPYQLVTVILVSSVLLLFFDYALSILTRKMTVPPNPYVLIEPFSLVVAFIATGFMGYRLDSIGVNGGWIAFALFTQVYSFLAVFRILTLSEHLGVTRWTHWARRFTQQ